MSTSILEHPVHRKTVRHYNEPGQLHFLTFSTYQRLPLLTNDLFRTMLARTIDASLDHWDHQLSGFVFMPEHVHMLVWPQREIYSISEFLYSVKKPFSDQVEEILKSKRNPLAVKLMCQERPGVTRFRFWQEGPGYDRNAWSENYLQKTLHYMHQNPVKRGLVPVPGRWRWSSWKAYNEPE